jgi:hypothetical protein
MSVPTNLALSFLIPSFQRKREPRDFSRLPLGPRLRGDDELSWTQAKQVTRCASASGRVLGEDALQGAAVHLEPACGFRDVAVAHFEDALDVLPAYAIG